MAINFAATRIYSLKNIKPFAYALIFLLSAFFALGFASAARAEGVQTDWIREFGTAPAGNVAEAIDADGNIYVGGGTEGAFPGFTNQGDADAFLRRYDSDGNVVWTRQDGTALLDQVLGVAVDSSGVYVVGNTEGALGGPNAGESDPFIRKYDLNGNVLWTRQPNTATYDEAIDVALDSSGNVYVAGNTNGAIGGETNSGGFDGFIRSYDANGNHRTTRQFGTSEYDDVIDIFVQGTNVYVVGRTDGVFSGQTNSGSSDVFIRRYNTSGTLIGTIQFGTAAFDLATGIVADASGVYVVGTTTGAVPGFTNAGGTDTVVRKYSHTGTHLWTNQFGTAALDRGVDIAIDSTGVYITGYTASALAGQVSAGGRDAFGRKYDTNGNLLWTHQFGTSTNDHGLGITTSSAGDVYIAGATDGTFTGQTRTGAYDAFVAKLIRDNDDDGIFNEVDTSVSVSSNDFNDGAGTTGTITARGDQTITVVDSNTTTAGVVATAAAGGGATPATISACGGASSFTLNAGDQVTITCGSVTAQVIVGPVEVTFFTAGGELGTASLGEGTTLTFYPDTATFIVPEDNPESVTIVVAGEELSLTAGTSLEVFSNHGEYVSSQDNRSAAARSGIGMPEQSRPRR